MAHQTMIDGTSYEVTGGRTLVDGTGYDVTGGKTLVDGTAYDVSFGATWAVYNVVTQYQYSGTYTTKTIPAYTVIEAAASGTEKFIYLTSTAPTPYSGTYTTRKNPPWQNSFYNPSITVSDLPYTVSGAYGYCMVFKTFLPSYAAIYSYPGTISFASATDVTFNRDVTMCTTSYSTVYSKGTTRYDDVTAPAGTYPDNGYQSGYWYVKIT